MTISGGGDRSRTFMIGRQAMEAARLEPGLYVVSTPIGNLSDITLRALDTLAGADIVACEDKRVTARLLDRYNIRVPELTAYHEHNADKEGPRLIEAVADGKTVALVSDAGTPLVSDPGQRLVAEARLRGLQVFPVPGPSAPLAALAASGFPSQEFTFAGFLPAKAGARRKALEALARYSGTIILFEAPTRLAACLATLEAVFGISREVMVCRELTKLHEEFRSGSPAELARHYSENPPRGEIVLLIAPAANETAAADPDSLLIELLERMPVSQAAAEAATLTGLPKRELYNRALALRTEKPENR